MTRGAIGILFVLFALTAAAGAQERGAAPARPLQGVTVTIDPGHNPGNASHTREISRMVNAGTLRKACDTSGTAEPGGISEARLTLLVSRLLERRLRALGAQVRFTHTETSPAWGPCIDRRGRLGNSGDLAISIHADGAARRGARGFHVIRPRSVRGWTDDIAGPSRRLALAVRAQMLRRTDLPPANYIGTGGIDVRSDLGGLNWSDVPKVLLEMGNMRSSRDMDVLGSARGRRRVAYAVADALVVFHTG